MKSLILLILFISSTSFAESPSWIHESERSVIGGDIIHWGHGEDANPEIALFKAKHMAIKSIIEECGGFASKYITPRKQHSESSFKGYRAWAKVSIEWDACQYGKSPEAKKNPNLENPKIVAGQKLYDQIMRKQSGAPEVEKEIRSKIEDLVKSEQNPLLHMIGALKNDIDYLKANQNKPQVVEPVRMPATNSQKKMCDMEVRALMQDAQMAANDYNGNMADPNVMPLYQKAMRKKAMCAKLQ